MQRTICDLGYCDGPIKNLSYPSMHSDGLATTDVTMAQGDIETPRYCDTSIAGQNLLYIY